MFIVLSIISLVVPGIGLTIALEDLPKMNNK